MKDIEIISQIELIKSLMEQILKEAEDFEKSWEDCDLEQPLIQKMKNCIKELSQNLISSNIDCKLPIYLSNNQIGDAWLNAIQKAKKSVSKCKNKKVKYSFDEILNFKQKLSQELALRKLPMEKADLSSRDYRIYELASNLLKEIKSITKDQKIEFQNKLDKLEKQQKEQLLELYAVCYYL